jgi:Arc/MetJ family transcription regulator
MRVTLTIEDELFAKAQRVSGLTEKTALVQEGLRALIERESLRQMARLRANPAQIKEDGLPMKRDKLYDHINTR